MESGNPETVHFIRRNRYMEGEKAGETSEGSSVIYFGPLRNHWAFSLSEFVMLQLVDVTGPTRPNDWTRCAFETSKPAFSSVPT